MDKGNLAIDPRGLIFESYRIEGIVVEECRSIFLEWALGLPQDTDMPAALNALMVEYGAGNPDHPMTSVVVEGLGRTATAAGRRGGRMARTGR